jgi:tripartite-type tricarboxylate transporter receptor subunit TctC
MYKICASIFASASIFAFLLLAPASAFAQAWPTAQPIKVITPFSAGSATDIIGRAVFDQVSAQIGQTIVM